MATCGTATPPKPKPFASAGATGEIATATAAAAKDNRRVRLIASAPGLSAMLDPGSRRRAENIDKALMTAGYVSGIVPCGGRVPVGRLPQNGTTGAARRLDCCKR